MWAGAEKESSFILAFENSRDGGRLDIPQANSKLAYFQIKFARLSTYFPQTFHSLISHCSCLLQGLKTLQLSITWKLKATWLIMKICGMKAFVLH